MSFGWYTDHCRTMTFWELKAHTWKSENHQQKWPLNTYVWPTKCRSIAKTHSKSKSTWRLGDKGVCCRNELLAGRLPSRKVAALGRKTGHYEGELIFVRHPMTKANPSKTQTMANNWKLAEKFRGMEWYKSAAGAVPVTTREDTTFK